MRLIKKKIKDNSWIKSFGKKVAGVALASTITFTSLLGLSSCGKQETPEIETGTSTTNTQTQEQIESLQEMLATLESIVSQLDIDNDVIRNKIAELKLELELDIVNIDNVQWNQDKAIEQVSALVSEIQKEITSLKDKMEMVESNQTTIDKTLNNINTKLNNIENNADSMVNFESIKAENEALKQQIEESETQIAKVNARLAVSNLIDDYYTTVTFSDDFKGYTSPNGECVIERGENNDYAYYNKETDMAYISNEGEEMFAMGQHKQFDFTAMITNFLSDTSLTLNKESSNEGVYIFSNEAGAQVSVYVEYGTATEVKCTALESGYNIYAQKSSKERFDYALLNCKACLQSIGLFEAFKKDLDESLNYKYKGITAINEIDGVVQEGTGVFSGQLCAAQTTNTNNQTYYSIQNQTSQYVFGLDSSNQIIEELTDYNQPLVDLTESFKLSVASGVYYSGSNTIS